MDSFTLPTPPDVLFDKNDDALRAKVTKFFTRLTPMACEWAMSRITKVKINYEN